MARLTLGYDLLLSAILLSAIATTCVWYERHLYLSTTVRNVIMWSLMDLILLLVLIIILRWLGTWRGWWPWAQIEAIADRVGARLGTAADRLLNALQLERRLAAPEAPANADLLDRSVGVMTRRLKELKIQELTPHRYRLPLRLTVVMLGLMVLAWAIAPGAMSQAAGRMLHPDREYSVPTPFILLSLTGDTRVLGGDTTKVFFTAIGAIPPAVELVWEDQRGRAYTANLPLEGDRYTYQFEDIHDDLRYYVRFINPAWFSPWDEIASLTHTITLIDRPVIEELSFTIIPPEYTGEPLEEVGGNVADITALGGSQVNLRGRTNLRLRSASLNLDGEEIPIPVEGNSITGSFTLEHTTGMIISVVDTRGVINANPINYTFTALPDYAPILSMIQPKVTVDLDESMIVPIHFDVSDDFGFSRAQVAFELHHPEYLTQDDRTYTHGIPELLPTRRSQRVTHGWELIPLNLVPGDEVHFHIEVYDNNIISGPGKAVSGTLVARLPTLTDLFTRAAERSDEAAAITEGTLDDLEEVKALLEEMELAFRGEEQVSWEQQQKGKEVLATLEEIIAAMESVQNQIAELGSKAEGNSLFSDEILKKYDEIQNLLEEIMTPELEEAMTRLRDALEKMDPDQLKNALQNMQFQASEFEAQLDRFLDIFRRALAEMKLDEVVKRLEQMVATEEQLLQQLEHAAEEQEEELADDDRSQPGDKIDSSHSLRDLAARHEAQERALNAVRETMSGAAESIVPYSPESARQLSDLRNSDLTKETEEGLQEGTRSLQSQQLDASQSQLQHSEEMLRILQDEAVAIQEQFQRATVNEMLTQFQRVMSGVLTTSKQQEQLLLETEKLRHNSPRVREAAEVQHQLLKGMSRLIGQLIALSSQSFHITPEVGRKVGRANAAMNKAVESLEANDPQGASRSQRESMTGLNETAVALSNAMAVMQQSGSASGYEQFLQRMQNLTQGQQGLNEQVLSMQLGQMSGMSQIELMRRLQARQRQLAQVLEQILEDFPSQSGGKQRGLGEALQDMEDVIQDFQRRRVTRQTLERQQKIITRLLDSQKSLTVQDFKEERRGEAPTQILTYTGPSGLPTHLGEREDLIMQAMEKALRAGYSQGYQVIIQSYFQQLAGRSSPER
ncbi:MAG: hypothetical protein JSU77_01000 [Fidelibacterota bacterium]|nr:MAG: hypothetical protein JSU77_01000 [Candidatus Neomarinimicrobiota bacterium]